MAERESSIQAAIRLALGQEHDVTLFRNNCGQGEFWLSSGKTQRVQYGLCVGSSDLIGLLAPSGRFIALEIKSESGRETPEQKKFQAHIRAMGGFAATVRSVEEARAALERARRGESQ